MVIDDKFKAQIAHVLKGGNLNSQVYGNQSNGSQDFEMKAILISKSQRALDSVLKTFSNGVFGVQYQSFVADTEKILQNELGYAVGMGKNYPAGMRALLINYKITNVHL